ncbi:MAG TPA: TraR/DksA family transcriptional regulator [Candidatus Binataceae bacterium]|nr:TraR/DksA family transcriptional regulator [Candidatus Binataceae bacterium]
MKTRIEDMESRRIRPVTELNRRAVELKAMLNRERADAISRIEVFRREQREDAPAVSGDEMDIARSLGDAETRASLIERARERLHGLDAAIDRLEAGEYGICADCGEEIAMARLVAIPCAELCIDCQQITGRFDRRPVPQRSSGVSAAVVGSRWYQPSEAAVPRQTLEQIISSGGQQPTHFDSPFGAESQVFEAAGALRRKRGRPRKTRDHSENRPH